MQSIKVDSQREMNKQPVGGYIALANAVKGKRYSKYVISKNMNELLVSGVDYQRSDRKELLEHLYQLSNGLEEAKIEGKFVTSTSSIIKDVVCVTIAKTV